MERRSRPGQTRVQEVFPVPHLLPRAILPQGSHRGPHSRAGLSSRETLWAQKLSKGDITGEVGLQRFHREGVVQEFLSSV